jgi:hypothetical protein
MGSDPQYASYPDLSLAQHIFHLTNPSSSNDTRKVSAQTLQDAILRHKMAPLFRYLAHPVDGVLNATGESRAQRAPPTRPPPPNPVASVVVTKGVANEFSIPWDEALYARLTEENQKELENLEKEEVEAAEKAGETEVQAAKGKRAEFWARVGDKVGRFLAAAAASRSWEGDFCMQLVFGELTARYQSGQSTGSIRGGIREGRRLGNPDRFGPCHDPGGPILRR